MGVLSSSFPVCGADITSGVVGSFCLLFSLPFCGGVDGLTWMSELVDDGGSSLKLGAITISRFSVRVLAFAVDGASGCACVSDVTAGPGPKPRIGLEVYQRPNRRKVL